MKTKSPYRLVGQGHCSFTAETRVQTPLGTHSKQHEMYFLRPQKTAVAVLTVFIVSVFLTAVFALYLVFKGYRLPKNSASVTLTYFIVTILNLFCVVCTLYQGVYYWHSRKIYVIIILINFFTIIFIGVVSKDPSSPDLITIGCLALFFLTCFFLGSLIFES